VITRPVKVKHYVAAQKCIDMASHLEAVQPVNTAQKVTMNTIKGDMIPSKS